MGSRITRTYRWLGLVAAVLMCAMPAASTVAQDATPVAGSDLDLAAMTLTVDDLASVGLVDYVIADGRAQSLEDRVMEQASSDFEADRIRSGLGDLGWERNYRARMVAQTDAATQSFSALLMSTVTQFSKDADMDAAWEAFSAPDDGPGVIVVPDVEVVGDEAIYTELGGVEFDDGTLHAASRYTFLSENLVGDVIVYSSDDQVLDSADIVSLAETQLARMESVRDGGAPDLSNKVLRWRGLGLSDPDLANYLKLDGSAWDSLGDDEIDIARNIASYEKAVSHFRYEATISETAFQQASIALFETEADAETYVAEAFERSDSQKPEGATLEVLKTGPSFSDDSVLMKAEIPNDDGTVATGYALFASYGKETIGFSIISLIELPEDLAFDMLSTQVECYESGSCLESVELPEDFAS